jgi:hypothetical protein
MRKLAQIGALILTATVAGAAEPTFPPECPRAGSMEIIDNPSQWADQCFKAVNGRLPSSASLGETSSEDRDIDLDGTLEHLEIRGTGNAMKQIYVFSESDMGFIYLGVLNAQPSFDVMTDLDGKATITYIHRFGADHSEERRIRYIGNEFVELKIGTVP